MFQEFRPPQLPEPAPMVRVMPREDVTWNRPVFRAPPLKVQPPLSDIAQLEELARGKSFSWK